MKQAQLREVLTEAIGQRAVRPQPRRYARVQPTSATLSSGAGLRILVAEDNPTNQRVALMMLKRLGYRADAVADGTEVLEMLRQASYDVLLLDIRMPRMNGFETTQQIIAEWPSEQRPHIVAMTADVTQETREECMRLGMATFISKPVNEHALARALAQYRDAPLESIVDA